MGQAGIYIVTNHVLYTGITRYIKQPIYIHKYQKIKSFTKQYCCNKLVCYEIFDDMYLAISREKQIKARSRKNMLVLINAFNPSWKDLYDDI